MELSRQRQRSERSSKKQSRERQQSNSGNNRHSSPLLKPLSYCDTQRNYSAETRSATYPSHPTMQHAATPQQLLLGWNRCQSTSTYPGADAVSSAIIKTMNVWQRRWRYSETSMTFKRQWRALVVLVIGERRDGGMLSVRPVIDAH